ncbi:hypothetical protein [Kitasatospora sp. NPDC048407]|uniref:hypothetical protein n=1 Tax=Kitasatospora sp. NPDC048407 TaxID=3364051 RepID=UPI00370FC7E4
MTIELRDYARLSMGLFDLGWEVAEENLPRAGTGVVKPDAAGPRDAVREANLELLKVYREMIKAIEDNIARAQARALGRGASYADIARARGVSRQAVRQDWEKRTKQRPVVLVGGPKDGFNTTATDREQTMRWGCRPGIYQDPDWADRRGTLTYRRSETDPKIFVFDKFEPDNRPDYYYDDE